MLNRRLVRRRVMQSLYAYEKARSANFLLANDLIAEAFAPDLNSMEKQDKNKLQGLIKLSQSVFSDEEKGLNATDQDVPQNVRVAIVNAREHYKLRNKKDFDFFKQQLLIDAEKVYDIYIYLLTLLSELASKFDVDSNIIKSKVIKALKVSKDLDFQCLKRNIHWENERVFINKLYNEALKNNQHILDFQARPNFTAAEDLAIVKYIIKNILLKHEDSEDFFNKMTLYWTEDTEILRTMLFHTFDDFEESGVVKIEVLDHLWDETKDFMSSLFVKTHDQEKQFLDILSPFLKNWEIDRIIETDRILLKMAICELIEFPSIPLKVTINEVIEISKNYSSAKSGQFVNGILDSVIKHLESKGMIKKSGRGMLDK